jgi:hypothetical protein
MHGRHGIFHQEDSILLGLADPAVQLVIALAQRLKKLFGLNYRGSSRHRAPLIGLQNIFDLWVFGCLDPPDRAAGTEKNRQFCPSLTNPTAYKTIHFDTGL